MKRFMTLFLWIMILCSFLLFFNDGANEGVPLRIKLNKTIPKSDNLFSGVISYKEKGELILKNNKEKSNESNPLHETTAIFEKSEALLKEKYYSAIVLSPEEAMRQFPAMVQEDVQSSKWVYMFNYYILKNLTIEMPPEGYSGDWKSWHANGQLHSEVSYKDGRRSGGNRQYYKNGAIKCDWNYVEGYRQGVQRTYHPNGQLKSECTRVRDVMEGLDIQYSKKGLKHSIVYWKDDGRRITILSKIKKIDERMKYHDLLSSKISNSSGELR